MKESLMIKCENITKRYGNKIVVNDITITLSKGEICVVTGPSGAGKSSLLKIASFIETPSTGTLWFRDNEYKFCGKQTDAIRKHYPEIGVVFQNLFLWPHLSNKENILLPVQKNWDSNKKIEFEKLVELFSLQELLEKFPNQCSMGQRQRIAIVRSFLLDSEYYFLDEITSSLDIEQIGVLLNYLRVLKEKGKGIFLITHFLKFAHLAADKILFLENGMITEQGGKDILITPQTDRLRQFLNTLEYLIP